jgi:hypothetical protein
MVVLSSFRFAKAPTDKITISDPDHKYIEITDGIRLSRFPVRAGPGTSSNDTKSLRLTVTGIGGETSGIRRYQLKFYVKPPDERLVYVVCMN